MSFAHKVLVTGGAGFIGHHLVKRLLLSQRNYKIIVIDNSSNGNKNFLDSSRSSDKISIYKDDIRNRDVISNIFQHERIDTCIHLAAKISVSKSILDPFDTLQTNVNGTLNILEACSNNQVKNFVLASTGAVYGEPKKMPISEDHILDPISPYAASKVAAEALVSSYRRSEKIKNAISLRLFNVYGEGQNIEYAGVITSFAERLARGLPPVIYGDGEQTRDFISVNDVVNAIIAAAESNYKISSSSAGVFNIATGKPITINDLAQTMIRISGLDLEPIYKEERKGDIKYSTVDITKSKNILGFIATEKVELALRQMLKLYDLQK